MEKKEEETRVVFRIWKDTGDCMALFPDIVADPKGNCECYQHVGQHGAADYAHCIRASRPAKPSEYAALKKELESAPYTYRLRVVKRRW